MGTNRHLAFLPVVCRRLVASQVRGAGVRVAPLCAPERRDHPAPLLLPLEGAPPASFRASLKRRSLFICNWD